jgi:chemotaxis protein CheD
MCDPRFPHEIAVIMPGEYFVSRNAMIVYTVLGSCISVCLRDTVLGIGGMNHFMLPAPNGHSQNDSWGRSARYGSYAMELLINEIMKQGGKRDRFEVKVFGGAKIYEGKNDVGASNTAWVIEYLGREGLVPVKVDVGDRYPRKIYYFTESGRVLLKRIKKIKTRTVFEREEEYKKSLYMQKTDGEITLF